MASSSSPPNPTSGGVARISGNASTTSTRNPTDQIIDIISKVDPHIPDQNNPTNITTASILPSGMAATSAPTPCDTTINPIETGMPTPDLENPISNTATNINFFITTCEPKTPSSNMAAKINFNINVSDSKSPPNTTTLTPKILTPNPDRKIPTPTNTTTITPKILTPNPDLETPTPSNTTTTAPKILTPNPDQETPTPTNTTTQEKKNRGAVQYTLSQTSKLATYLPTGILLAFETLLPSIYSQSYNLKKGKCPTVNIVMIEILISLCSLACFSFYFTDTLTYEGKDFYGIVTPRGLKLFSSEAGAVAGLKTELEKPKYHLSLNDFIQAIMSVFVFIGIVLEDERVRNCVFPNHSKDTDRIFNFIPLVVGVIASAVFIRFNNERRGVGWFSI